MWSGSHDHTPPLGAQRVRLDLNPGSDTETSCSGSHRGASGAGGEHVISDVAGCSSDGSSPRRRGTPLPCRRTEQSRRFIPARAGNTLASACSIALISVHPRAGGEHIAESSACGLSYGSSPRGRGTPAGVFRGSAPGRFIPARAGNTSRPASSRTLISVHPRAGGEHTHKSPWHCGTYGSSPRGRGTLRVDSGVPAPSRFIPARAGNTCARSRCRWITSVRPRAGGEHANASTLIPVVHGSSPRGRGTHPPRPVAPLARRFIPARAGSGDVDRHFFR